MTILRVALTAALALGLLVAQTAAEAQQAGKVYRIGVLFEGTPLADMAGPEPRSPILRSFLTGLRELGYVVILASGERTTPALLAATTVIPIVQPTLTDPVERGYAKSLARPAAHLTGLSLHADREIYGKLLELLKEAAPRISRVAVLHRASPGTSPSSTLVGAMAPAAERVRVTLLPAVADREDQFAGVLSMIERERADALITELNGVNTRLRMRIVQFAAKSRVPVASGDRSFAATGGLLSYGPDTSEHFRRAAIYVDKILKGARPADLPVEQPTKFELVINLETAKTLGLTIPKTLLLRADQVIE